MADEQRRIDVENPDQLLPGERGGPRPGQAVPAALPPTQEPPQGTTSEAITQDEGEQREQAAQARAIQFRRPKATPDLPAFGPPEKPAASLSDEELRTRYLTGPQDNGEELMDRMRLNRQDAYYRGSIAGSSRLAALSHIYGTPDGPDDPPERKAANKQAREEYQHIVADLASYDEMQSFGTSLEAMVSFAGQLEGTMVSPESWIGWGAKGASTLTRTALAALQQGAVQGAVDPIVQSLNIASEVQDSYDPARTAMAFGLGGVIGGGAHLLGEGVGHVVGQLQLRATLKRLAREDAAFGNVREAIGALDPDHGIQSTLGPPAEALREPVEGAAAPAGGRAPAPAEAAPAGTEGASAAAVPPPPPGTVRMYHGGYGELGEGERHVTADPQYARDYGGGGRTVWYVDVPENAPWLQEVDTAGTGMPRQFSNSVAPAEVMAGAHRLPEGGAGTGGRGAIWANADYDIPVRILDEAPQEGPGGRRYQAVEYEGRKSYVPLDELRESPKPAEAAPAAPVASEGATAAEPSPAAGAPEAPKASEAAPVPPELIPALVAFPDMRAGERGEFSLNAFTPEEQDALRKHGLVKTFTDPDGAPYEGVLEERLWQLRKQAQEERAARAKDEPKASADAAAVTPRQVAASMRAGSLRRPIENLGSLQGDKLLWPYDVSRLVPPEVVARLEQAGLATDGKMTLEQWKRWDGEMSQLRSEGLIALGADEQPPVPGLEPMPAAPAKEAAKPMRGGEAPPPAGGLFDEEARRQTDIFGLQATGARPDLEALAERKGGGNLTLEQARPEEGVAGAPSPLKDAAIRSLQQLSMDLAKALGVPLRQGRVEMRKAIGTYNRRSGVVRVKEVPDFEAVTHEMAHALEGRLGQDLTDLTERYGYELIRLDYDQSATGQRVNEGFAEYMRMVVGNPEAALNFAPGFTPDFRAFMADRAPDLMAAFDRASKAYRAYLDAPSVDAVRAVRRSQHEDIPTWRRVLDAVKLSELPNTVKSFVQSAYAGLLDDKAPVARAVRELGRLVQEREGGRVALNAADNPDVLLRLRARASQAATRDMMDGVRPYRGITPEGPSLANALAYAFDDPSVWGKWDPAKKADFSAYLIAKRAEFLWREFDAGRLVSPPVAFSAADARMAMQEMERAYPRFRTASDMVHQYSKNLVEKQFDGGLITRDLADKLLEQEFYVPFMRDMSDKPMAGGGFGGGAEGPGTTDTVRRIRGSARDIKDPIESMMMQTFLINRTLRNNDIMLSLVNLAERAGPGGGKYVEKIPANEARKYTFDLSDAITRKAKEIGMMPEEAEAFSAAMGEMAGEDPLLGSYWKVERTTGRGEPILFYKEGGELKAARFISKDEGLGLYELLAASPEPVNDIFRDVIAGAAGVMRSGIVTNPTFAISNWIRDQVSASILRSDYVPFYSGIQGLESEIRQGNSAVLYGYAGGVAGGASVGPVEHAIEADVNALKRRGYLVERTSSFKGLLELSSITEAGTRNSIFSTVFEAARRRGLSDYDAMIEGAFQAQDLLDFSRHGSHTMAIRSMIPFLNAHIQGLDKARRTMIDPVLREMKIFGGQGRVFEQDSADLSNAVNAWLKFGAVGGGLGAMWAAINWEKESYRDANPYFKGTHLVVPFGKKVIVVPKPFELGMGFTFGEYAYAKLAQHDARAASQFAEAAWQALQPPNPVANMPLVTPAMELTTGVSMFTMRSIVPGAMQRLPAEQQYDDRTSDLAKWLGKQTGLSPMKIEYAVGSQFGNWGRDVMALSQGVNEDRPAAAWDDAIFFRRFVKDPTRSSDSVTRFWDYMGETTGKFNQDVAAYDRMVKQFRDGDARSFVAKLPSAEKAFVTLRSAANEDGKPAFSAADRRLHPLQRAFDAVTLLNGLRRELAANTFSAYETGTQRKMDPETRRNLLDNVRELAQMEMRNALVITAAPGYEGRPVLDPNDTMDKIKAASPEVAQEIATRYATAKVYKTTEVAKAWPAVRDEVNRNGSQADLMDAVSNVAGAGPEFEGERVRKPTKRRIPVTP